MTLIVILSALIIDWFIGEPKHGHPLVAFGRLVKNVETRCYKHSATAAVQILRGGLAWILLVLPITILTAVIVSIPEWGWLFAIIILYFCIGHQSLYAHVSPIILALQNNDEHAARELTSRIVSRDKDSLNIAKASIESVLENGNDAVFAALFWFVVAGAPGVIAYRLINTLDAMWGYKNDTYLYFGRVSARMDDLMNYIPARLTALSYALLGNTRLALVSWRQQAHLCDSPNAGVVMASGAGALDIELGGAASYGGTRHQRPLLGSSKPARTEDIQRALKLVTANVLLWLLIILVITGVSYA